MLSLTYAADDPNNPVPVRTITWGRLPVSAAGNYIFPAPPEGYHEVADEVTHRDLVRGTQRVAVLSLDAEAVPDQAGIKAALDEAKKDLKKKRTKRKKKREPIAAERVPGGVGGSGLGDGDTGGADTATDQAAGDSDAAAGEGN